jgi:eukaryotic-like serine/threonine-protein kinase
MIMKDCSLDEDEIFEQARGFNNPTERRNFLAQACHNDAVLQARLEKLLAAEVEAEGFFSGDATLLPATLFSVVEKPGDRIGRYKLLEKIGEGGCGVVYMAEQEEPIRRKVALKIIKLGMDTQAVVARFEAERQALAMMDHPNIAKVLDAGATATGRPYFVMELVRGLKIMEFCDNHKLSTRERLGLFKQVCHAIQHSHQKGIIHRDIKPSNVLVTLHDGLAIPKVIDFGIAKATTGQLLTDKTLFTAFEQFIGTPAYMSPEQAEMSGLDVDTRTDIYSLGVLLYELLIGRTPFETRDLLASGLDAMRRTIREKEPPLPSTHLSTLAQSDLAQVAKRHRSEPSKLANLVRGDLDWIVMKALEKERSRRYETAEALSRDIQRHLDHEPILARPASSWSRISKWARRRPAAAAVAGVIAVATLACAVLAVFASKQAISATRQSKEAELAREAATASAQQEQEGRQRVQRNVVRQYVANGSRLMNEGDLFTALLWYVEALRLDAGDPRREESHRIRIASVLRQCPKLLNVFSHGTMLYHAEFSPDGNKLATASNDHTARLWNLETGENTLVLPHNNEVNDVGFSQDGLQIVTSSQDKTARVWDSGTGALLHSMLHSDNVWRSAFTPDGAMIGTACEDGTVRLWNAITGERIGAPLQHESAVGCIVFSPDGRLLGTRTASGAARVWEITTHAERIRVNRSWTVFDPIAFSPNGRQIAMCDGSRVRIWNAETFEETFSPPFQFQEEVNSIAFSGDGTVLTACSADFSAQLWNSAGEPILGRRIQHSGPILETRISPDGRRLLTAGQDAIAQLWNLRTGEPVGPPLKHILHVKFCRFNPDGRRLLFNSCDQAARIWDLATADLPAPGRPVFANDHRLVSANGEYRLLDGDGKVVWITEGHSGRKLVALPHGAPVTYASFSPDGRSIVTACEERNPVSSKRNDIFVWEVPSGRRLSGASMTHDFTLLYVAFSPGTRDQRLLTCGFDFTARVWDARTGQPMSAWLRHRQRVSWGAFSPDGLTVATASWDKTVRVWDAYTGNPLTPPLEHRAIPAGAFWSTDLKRLHTITIDGYLQVWDLATGEPLTPPRKTSEQHRLPPAATASAQLIEALPRDDRPVEDLVALSRMLAVARIETDGTMVPLQLYELSNTWNYLRTSYPNQFTCTPAEIAAWHEQESRNSESEGNSTAAEFHHKQAERARLAQIAMSAGPARESSHRGSRWLSIPSRDPQATSDQIDLSDYYNLGLHDSLNQKPDGNDLSQLPEGLHRHGGVLFDIRGLIHLAGTGAESVAVHFPESVTGIRVGRKCRRVHFLEGSSWSGNEDLNMTIGSYVLHYADGDRAELPIIYGQDIRDWWQAIGHPLSTAIPVWTAPNRLQGGGLIGIYKNTRENPRPNEELVSIDFISRTRIGAPFLVAITIE